MEKLISGPGPVGGAIMMMTLYIAVYAWGGKAVSNALFDGFLSPTEVILFGALFKAIPILSLANQVYFHTRLPPPTFVQYSSYAKYIGIGLLFSGIGDISLDLDQLPGYEWLFIIGLGSFLVGHLLYVVGFLSIGHKVQHSWKLGVVLLFALGWMLSQLLPALATQKDGDALRIPVIIYTIAIGSMVYCAGARSDSGIITLLNASRGGALEEESSQNSQSTSFAGALLFALSDSILAWDKFIQPIGNAKMFVMITYYGAQLLIARGVFVLGMETPQAKKEDPRGEETKSKVKKAQPPRPLRR